MKRKYTQEEVSRLMVFGLYFNPDDRNIFVRKRWGAWTMNMGNLWSWVIAGGILLGISLIMALQYAA